MLVAKLDAMALVVAEADNDDAMVAPDTDGGAITTYFTERPTTVADGRLTAADLKRREDVLGQLVTVASL